MDPALGVDYVADGVSDPADQIVLVGQLDQQGLHFALVGDEELHVVAGGETQVAVAILVGDVANVGDEIGAHQPGRSHPHRG